MALPIDTVGEGKKKLHRCTRCRIYLFKSAYTRDKIDRVHRDTCKACDEATGYRRTSYGIRDGKYLSLTTQLSHPWRMPE